MAKKVTNNKYIKLAIILFGTVFITILASNLYKNFYTNKINNSYISKYISGIQYNELKNAVLELSSESLIYISYTGNSDIYNFEVKLKKIIKDQELTDQFLYLNITEIINEKNYINKLNTDLELENKKIAKLPAIIYYRDNKVIDLIDSSEGMLNSGKVVQLIEKYELTK